MNEWKINKCKKDVVPQTNGMEVQFLLPECKLNDVQMLSLMEPDKEKNWDRRQLFMVPGNKKYGISW